MSLRAVSDGFLAGRAAGGDDVAFAELARRYWPLIVSVTLRPALGVEVADERQEALIGLFEACREYDPARGRFAGLARLRVRSKAWAARASAQAHKHRILTEAARDGDDSIFQLAQRAAAPAGADPARVVEARDTMREHAQAARRSGRRPCYNDEQVATALVLLAQGKTFKEAAFAVGAPPGRVACWAKRAGQPRPGCRRRYTPAEMCEVVALVQKGASLRQAGATVGASNATVLRWLRQAA